jgi:toxin-antitoxin system PIN domain toxin
VKLVDANVLLYAVNASEPRHREARDWLDGELSSGRPVGFSWIVLLAFVRLTTRSGLFPSPLSLDDALEIVRAWLDQPLAVVLEPTTRHLDVLAGLLRQTGSGGNLVNDAHLAALAVEHDATVVTYDGDFARFDGVRWTTPAAAAEP